MKAVWMNTLAWALAVAAALGLALAAPSESTVMGKLPSIMAKRLDQRPVSLPQGLTADRTLALITFNKGQAPVIETRPRRSQPQAAGQGAKGKREHGSQATPAG